MTTLDKRRSLAYFSPCIPDPRGTGWEQRAFALLSGYSAFMDVHLWFMPTIDNPDLSRLAPVIERVRSATAFYPSAFNDPSLGLQRRLIAQLGTVDVAHVFRLPQLAANIAHGCLIWDLDELPWTAKRVGSSLVTSMADASVRMDPAYTQAAQKCRVVMGCSAREILPGARRFVTVPNITAMPVIDEAAPIDCESSLLFVGNLNYLPNVDALEFFQNEVLPALVNLVPDVRVVVVGRAPATDEAVAAVNRLRRSPQIAFVFDVPDCTPYYLRCAASIAPIRAGGGTRIKIVESFAHRRAVVSTTKGCEGLDVVDGTHLLIADDPKGFAESCARLLLDGALSRQLAQAGYEYFEARHTQCVVDACLRQTIDALFPAKT